jgi:xanthine dehydrogenase accessory factor
MYDILDTVERWLNEGKPVALATVTSTWGSSPRQAGAKLAATPDLAMVGSVSGGCVETAVLEEALEALADGKPRLLRYGVSDDRAWEVGLACGGKVSVYVEPLERAWWAVAADAARRNSAAVTITIIEGPHAGQKMLADAAHGIAYSSVEPGSSQYATLERVAQQALREQRKTSCITVDGLALLIDVHRPQPRLVVIGGAHVAQVLCRLAQIVGYQVLVIDPRSAFATPERFPGVKMLSHQYPDKVLPGLNLDTETYVAVLTHDPKIDDPALCVALASPAPYVGVMSGKRTHQLRIERLTRAGVPAAQIERIHAPIGLNLGSQTPEEIALSIMAQIVAVRNGVGDGMRATQAFDRGEDPGNR